MENETLIKNIDIRLKKLEQQIENNKIDFLKYSLKHKKTFKMKYATKAMQATNNIETIKRKIENYKNIREKYNGNKTLDASNI